MWMEIIIAIMSHSELPTCTVGAVAVTSFCLAAQNVPRTAVRSAYLPTCRTQPQLFMIIHRL